MRISEEHGLSTPRFSDLHYIIARDFIVTFSV
jgi:hypothetical protein